MSSYKVPGFQDRIDAAAEAKQKALDRLRAKPAMDEAVVAERQAARQAREAKEREKRAAKKKAAEEAETEQAEVRAAEEASPAPPTEAERKAARDARYAARKRRK
ncbi:MAG: hypothetical protein JWO81_98 [Alphaproteobacteria bacterium]|nr:hypothetical protein [Alphaproteobacteria bacterium]